MVTAWSSNLQRWAMPVQELRPYFVSPVSSLSISSSVHFLLGQFLLAKVKNLLRRWLDDSKRE